MLKLRSSIVLRRPGVVRSSADGFSLIELLVAAVLVIVIIGIALPALQRVGDAGKRVRCVQNLRQIGVLFQGYLADNRQTYPAAYTQIGYRFWPKDLMDAAGDTEETNRGIFLCPGVREPLQAFLEPGAGPVDPGSGTYAYVSYAINAFGVAAPTTYAPGLRPARHTSIEDPSKVLLALDFADHQQPFNGWYYAWANAVDDNWDAFHTRHGSVNALFCDGHVKAMTRRQLTDTSPANDIWREGRYTITP